MRTHGPWTILESKSVYADPWMTVIRDEVIRPDGQPGTFAVAHIKPGVCVLAVDGDGVAYLTEEFHYGVGRVTLEAVSGGIDDGETAEAAARRELREELGIDAESWTDLGTVDPFTSMVLSPTRLFLARELSFGPPSQEGCESIALVKMSFPAAVRAVIDGEITHAPSCVVILKAAHSQGSRSS